MPTPSGQISLDDVNIELGIASGTQINMDSAPVRGLAEVPTGAISMSDLQGKSNAQFVAATGGTITTSGDFKIHEFNSSDTFTVTQAGNAAGSNTVEYLVLAGGGGGGGSQGGGGGGAGGQLSNYPSPAAGGHPVSATSYPITVGAGGSARLNGNDSTFDTITATKGGGGGGGFPGFDNGQPGGSGGGSPGRDNSRRAGGSGNSPPKSAPATPVQGFGGGAGSDNAPPRSQSGGGGGGSGAVGQADMSNQGGSGGAGRAIAITGSPVTRGGGGGGSSDNQDTSPGGSGGGGRGGADQTFPGDFAQNGSANFGGGGGGNNRNGTPVGAGGSGKVIIRYKFQ